MTHTESEIRLKHLVHEALQEDIGDGDHSTLCCIPGEQKGRAVLRIKEQGVLAGMAVAKSIFNIVEPSAEMQAHKQDGDQMHVGEVAFDVAASVHTILKAERLVLNCMQRMSGIATLTNRYVAKLKGYHTKILDTRKTTPNFRLLEKEAVRIGGAVNHRFGLFDMIMLKDNHVDYAGGVAPAIEKAWHYVNTKRQGLKIEIETRNLDDVRQVAAVGKGKVFRVMIDNFKPEDIAAALDILEGNFETEASGGINLSNVEAFAQTGVDYVSIGALIHQAQSLDLSLKAEIG